MQETMEAGNDSDANCVVAFAFDVDVDWKQLMQETMEVGNGFDES